MVFFLLAIAQLAAARSLQAPSEVNDNGRGLKFLDLPIFNVPAGQNASSLTNTLLDGNATSGAGSAAGSANINGADLSGPFLLFPSASGNSVTGGGGTATTGAGGTIGVLRDFVRIETSADNNVATAGNGQATNGINVNVGLVDSGTLAVQANSSDNVADATGGPARNGNLINVQSATKDSNIGIESNTDGNTASVDNLPSAGLLTTGSTVVLGSLDLGSGSLFISTNDQNNVIDTNEPAAGFGGSYVDLTDVQSENPISISITGQNNLVNAPLGADAGGRVNLGQ